MHCIPAGAAQGHGPRATGHGLSRSPAARADEPGDGQGTGREAARQSRGQSLDAGPLGKLSGTKNISFSYLKNTRL